MKHSYLLLLTVIFAVGCSPQLAKDSIEINKERLLTDLQILSHDSLEGRGFGTHGNLKGQKFIEKRFEELGVTAAFESGYSQPFEHTIGGRRRQRAFPIADPMEDFSNVPDTTLQGANIAAIIPGKTDRVIVITAHHDHLGIINGKIYNGADDDGSGTASLFAMAAYFKAKSLKHTLIFAAVDAEEVGLAGSMYLVDNFPVSLEKISLNVNLDMISHTDSLKLWATGLYHYPQLRPPLDAIKSPIKLWFGHDDPNDEELDDWTDNSDHQAFHERKIPFIYFGVDDHVDYHRDTDEYENINPEFYVEAVKLIIQAIEGYDEMLD
ncbi:MAG: M28 family peptidase [Cyclobacteriaceae bacterium]